MVKMDDKRFVTIKHEYSSPIQHNKLQIKINDFKNEHFLSLFYHIFLNLS